MLRFRDKLIRYLVIITIITLSFIQFVRMLKATLKNVMWDLKKNTFCVEVAKAFKRNEQNYELN